MSKTFKPSIRARQHNGHIKSRLKTSRYDQQSTNHFRRTQHKQCYSVWWLDYYLQPVKQNQSVFQEKTMVKKQTPRIFFFIWLFCICVMNQHFLFHVLKFIKWSLLFYLNLVASFTRTRSLFTIATFIQSTKSNCPTNWQYFADKSIFRSSFLAPSSVLIKFNAQKVVTLLLLGILSHTKPHISTA